MGEKVSEKKKKKKKKKSSFVAVFCVNDVRQDFLCEQNVREGDPSSDNLLHHHEHIHRDDGSLDEQQALAYCQAKQVSDTRDAVPRFRAWAYRRHSDAISGILGSRVSLEYCRRIS